jgi:hypothetical protein
MFNDTSSAGNDFGPDVQAFPDWDPQSYAVFTRSFLAFSTAALGNNVLPQ